MKYFVLLIVPFLIQELPYKPKEEFEIKLDYQFKQRPATDNNTSVHLDETQKEKDRRTSTDLLPYLILKVKLLKINAEEARVKTTNNLNGRSFSKKIEEGLVITIDLGFTDDVKDRVAPNIYTLTFLSPKKSEMCKIVIHVEEDGTFLVNGEKRGKF